MVSSDGLLVLKMKLKWNVKVGLVGCRNCIIQVDQVLEWEIKFD
jgi:hypothetical protein